MAQPAIARLIDELLPGSVLEQVSRLGDDASTDSETTKKGIGYGASLLLTVRTPDGERRKLVFRTARANEFGHDRRSDRAAEALLSYDTRDAIPNHAGVIDVGAIRQDGRLDSLRDAGEIYWLTEFAPGEIYAGDLRRIGAALTASQEDIARCDMLVDYLVELHSKKIDRPAAYRRAIRDLVGHGEGIFGIADSYSGHGGVSLDRVQAIERKCIEWRWRLRGKESRLSRTHGDFHPFNILFDSEKGLFLLDASRGCQGDPADDVSCLAINYLFFAFEYPGSWASGFGPLWRGLWRNYIGAAGDRELLSAAPPFFAWRALVLANPLWYPNAEVSVRDGLLAFAERALEAGKLDPDKAEELFE